MLECIVNTDYSRFMNKIRIPAIITLTGAVLFSLLSVNFSLDVSLFSFPLSAAGTFFLSYFLYFKLLKKTEYSALKVSVKLLQYEPFILLASFILRRAGKNGTGYAYDVITVILWCVVFVFSQIVLYYLNDKRVYTLMPEWKSQKKSGSGIIASKKITMKSLLFEALDWIDALVQAVFMVLLIQIFILQLYVIPSESMVPSFLIGDRVVVLKTPSGPKFPLSDVGLPCVKKYKRGDVVVFRNPHYSMDRKSEVRSVVSQIIYMLTFTGINLNVDEKGEPKADPLVKRICGVPGEQLVMQDGVLYSRNSSSDEFKPVLLDQKFAAWNLNSVLPSVKKGIQMIPLSEKQYETMLEVEQMRRDMNLNDAAFECWSITKSFLTYFNKLGSYANGEVEISRNEYELFSDFYNNVKKILSCKEGFFIWFTDFMYGWENDVQDTGYVFSTIGHNSVKSENSLNVFDGDYYAEANFRLNVMIKLTAGRLYLRTVQLMAQGFNEEKIYQDEKIAEYLKTAQKLHFYVMILDQRNMPVFPASSDDGKPQYIPEGSYFMMGDNRFNSLDMRHSYESKKVSLCPSDEFSVEYYSNMAPQTVSRKYILGSAEYRFWPRRRMGIIKTK